MINRKKVNGLAVRGMGLGVKKDLDSKPDCHFLAVAYV